MAIPILGAWAFWHFNRETELGHWVGPIALIPGILIIAGTFAASYGSAILDTEILNGKVLSKSRVHGTYEQAYDCNCRTVTSTSGSGKNATTSSRTVCDTCYETHYTVEWTCDTTVGSYRIDKADTTSRSVYARPDPARYTSIKVGDPAAKKSVYTNYVQAVPNSLFAALPSATRNSFAPLLPDYPNHVYDFYKVNRFLTPGFSFTDVGEWNNQISLMMRDLGPRKQVNLIVVVAKTDDRSYAYALRDHWEGANKNDVVLVIGSLDGQKIEFVDVVSWTKSEIFKIELIDQITEQDTIHREAILNAVEKQIEKNFERRRMRDFEYLKGAIDPPVWLMTALLIVLIAGYGVATYFFSLKRIGRPRRY